MGSGGGSDQHFCLRWNNFHSNIATSFEQLRDHEDFVDVTLACEGRTIKAHKVVLSACSPYFRNLLKQNPCQHPIIILRDVAFVDVSALLSFVYQGEVYVSQERLTAFLHTAELLHIKGLTEQQHHHTTASTTHTGPITGTNINSSSCGGSNNSNLGSGIAVSLLAPHSGGTTVPLTHLIAAAPQPPHQQTEQVSRRLVASHATRHQELPCWQRSPHPAARGVPRSPSPTRPHSSPSPPLLPPPYIPPPSSHHISPPPKKRRHQQQQSSLTSQCASSIASPLSSSSSSTTTDPHPLSPPHPSDNPPPPIPALATPKIEVGTSLLSGPGSSCLLGGSTLAAALTAPRGDTPLSAASVSAVSAPPPLLLPVEVKQEAVESPLLLDDGGSSSSSSVGSNLMSEQQAVNLVLETNTGSPSPSCSILRQRIQGYQGSPDAPPPPNYPPPSRGVDDDGGGSDGGEGKEGLTPPSAVAIIRRQHMIGLAAAAAAAGVYNSGGGGGGGATASLSGGDAGQPTQSPQDAPGPASPGGSVVPGRHRWRCMQPRLCPFCWKTFSNSFNLKQHVVNVHTVGQGLQCHLCHKTVKNKWYLRKHHVTAHGAPLKRGKHATGTNNSLVLQHYGQQDTALGYQDDVQHEHGHYDVDNMHLQDEYNDGGTADALIAGDYCDRSMMKLGEYGDGSSTFDGGSSGFGGVAHEHHQRHHKRSSSSSSSSSAVTAPPSGSSPSASTPHGAGGALLSAYHSPHSPPPTRNSPPSTTDESSVASVAVRSYHRHHRHSSQRAASPGLGLHPLPSHSHQLA